MSNENKKSKASSDSSKTRRGRFKSFITNPGTIAAAVAAAEIIGAASAVKIYGQVFKRYERPDYSVTPGLVNYREISDILPREELPFYSGDTRLSGYYYPAAGSKGLVVFAHGLHAGADDYLSIYMLLNSAGYSVFSFDCKGTYSSDGDTTVGLCEALVDLDAALDFVNSRQLFGNRRLMLLGHSCGGYAVTAVLKSHPEVAAAAAIAPLNDACGMILQKGEFFAGEAAVNNLPAKYLEAHQKQLFGKYSEMTAVDGINSTDIPVLIAHGKSDRVVGFGEPTSVISHRSELRKSNVFYYIGTGGCGGHTDILYSEAANKYRKAVDGALKSIKNDDEAPPTMLADYCTTVNDHLYSEVNPELFRATVGLFDSVSGER